MMKFFKRYKSYLPIISGLLVVGCIGTSLSGYVPPVYAVETLETAVVADEKETSQVKKEKAETKETETEKVVQGKGNFDLKDGTYKGSANGYKGTVSVSVVIKDKSITAVNIDSTEDDDAFFGRAKKVIDQMISTQKIDVDVVSGATYSSNGIINAVKNALTGQEDTSTPAAASASAGGGSQGSTSVSTVNESGEWSDGTYYGTGTGFAGPIQVKVVVSGGKITDISIESTSDGDSYVSNASSGVISAILSNQTTNVDTVSGATYSSVGIINAVRNALSGAGGSASSGDVSSEAKETEEVVEPEVTGTIPYDDGIYYGIGDGYKGDIEVAVIIENQTIQSVLVLDTEDDEAFFGRAVALLDEIVKKQDTQVDTVSGATFSSEGLIGAVEDALENAEAITNGEVEDETEKPAVKPTNKPINKPAENTDTNKGVQPETKEVTETEAPVQTVYVDGTYDVSVLCTPDEDEDFDAYNLSMRVTIENDQIVGITNVSGDGGSGNESYIKRAVKGTSKITSVVDQIIALGNVDGVDAVSRATRTSNAIIEGCMQALEAARR